MKLKKYISKFLSQSLCILVLTMMFSCEDSSDMDLSLAVNNEKIELDAKAGETHIMVYSTGDWTVEFSEAVDWISVDKLHGSGNSSVVFTYAHNFGLPRSVDFILTRGSEKKIIKIVQKGDGSVLFKLASRKVELPKTELPVSLGLVNNLPYDLSKLQVEVIYDDETSEKWVSEIKITENAFQFYALENNLGEYRSARVVLKLVDGNGKVITDYADISQSVEEAYFNFVYPETTITKSKGAYQIDVETNINFSNHAVDVQFNYSRQSQAWITYGGQVQNKLLYNVEENETGLPRESTLALKLSNKKGVVYNVTNLITQLEGSFIILPYEKLRKMIATSSGILELTDQVSAISGIVISDAKNPNMESNPNTAFNKVDLDENLKTAYIQSLDGKYGFRIKTATVADNVFKHNQKVLIPIKGLTLEREANPDRYTLTGFTAANLYSSEQASANEIVLKERYVNDLTDADLYTNITLKEIEVALPHGAYINLNRGYTINNEWNTNGIVGGGYYDAGSLSLRDTQNGVINMLTNSSSQWGKTLLPKGNGTIEGILVHSDILRIGDLGKYQVRVRKESDIKLNNSAKAKTLVEWNWMGQNGTDIHSASAVQKDASGNVLPPIGTGKLYCTDSKAGTGLGANFINFPVGNVGAKGDLVNSAMHFSTKWWNTTKNEGEAFVFEFSTMGHTGKNFTINFNQGAGSGSLTTLHSPIYWSVRYSTDGLNYTELPNSTYKVRSLNWWGGTLLYTVSGNIDHSFVLPNELLNKSTVFIKLQPKNNICATSTGAENGTIGASLGAVNVRLGAVSFRYIQ